MPRAVPRRRVTALLLASVLVSVTATSCSTSGRELREPAMRSAVLAPASSSSASSAVVEGLEGFALTSPQFVAGGVLPADSGALDGNRSPALSWTTPPAGTAELALVVSDATAQNVYWVVTGVAASAAAIAPGTTPPGAAVRPNSAGHPGYDGPIVVSGTTTGVVFRLYALGAPLQLDPSTPAPDALRAIAAASFASATLSAVYSGEDANPQAG